MALDFDNSRTRAMSSQTAASGDVAIRRPMDLFAEFYQIQNNSELNPEQTGFMERIFEEAGGAGA